MKIRRRLLVTLALFISIAALAIDLCASYLVDRAVRERAAARLSAESLLLARAVEARWPGSSADADRWADETGASLGVRVTLIDPSGIVLGDSQVPLHDLPSLDNHLSRPEVERSAAGGTGEATRYSDSLGVSMEYFARRVGAASSPRGYVRLAIPAADLRAISGRYRLALGLVVLVCLALLASVAHVMVGRFSRPIERLSRIADSVASGGYDIPLEHDSRDEIGDLAVSVDRMRHALLDQMAVAESERRLLASILAGLREGILVVDSNRHLLLMNESLRSIFGAERGTPAGTPMFQIVWDRTVVEAFEEVLARGADVQRRVATPSGRSFELNVTPFNDAAGRQTGAIGLFFDVTRLEALEKVRRDFVADISHELRTPLASVRAAVETLTGGAVAEPETAEMFLAIVQKNTARMEAILNDLTDLSLIETGAITLSLASVDVAAAVREAAASLAARASARRISIETRVAEGLELTADRRRLDQVLTNLLDNAIKFNREGGTIVVSAHREKDRIVIEVEDTGPGIPSEALDRIFNRFYRVDRARSREAGGTGLGLAIVKHLVLLHGGAIHAENRAQGGGRFVIELPAAPRI